MEEDDIDGTETHPTWSGPDSHGQAAMLLVESMLHGLVARSVISVEDAIEMVDVASDVKLQTGAELGDSPANLQKSLNILAAVSDSLRNDLSVE